MSNGIGVESPENMLDMTCMVSNCCGASVYAESDICTECKEHCEAIKEGSDDE